MILFLAWRFGVDGGLGLSFVFLWVVFFFFFSSSPLFFLLIFLLLSESETRLVIILQLQLTNVNFWVIFHWFLALQEDSTQTVALSYWSMFS
jgi:hypothetical protein